MSRRVLSAMLAIATLAVAAFFMPAALAIRSAQQRGEVLELQREASIVASRVPPTGPIDETVLAPILDSSHRLALYAPDGTRLGGIGPRRPDAIVLAGLAGNFAEGRVGEDLVAAVPIRIQPNGSALVIRIEAPSAGSRGRFIRSLARLAAAAIAVLAVATTVGLWLSRRLNRPIEELRRWATAAAPGDAAGVPPDPTGIGELDALRTALVGQRERIAELLARERSFSSDVSHQLRTPVTAMRVAIETELESPRDDVTAALVESLDQLDRLESTITSLLTLTRHPARPIAGVDLLDLSRRRTERWRVIAAADERAIEVTGKPLSIRSDPDAIGHILDVLVENAVRHGVGTITVTVAEADGIAAIDVADEGAARPDALDDQRADAGHGIGLRLARSLAEAAGARIDVLPSPTTTFRVSLPIGP